LTHYPEMMRPHRRSRITAVVVLAATLPCVGCAAGPATQVWLSAYFVSPSAWRHYYPMAARDIEFGAITHVLHYAGRPTTEGTLDLDHYDVAGTAPELIERAHAAGRKVLFTIGSAHSNTYFRAATSPALLPGFIAAIRAVVDKYGYDGVDIDWETLDPIDARQYTAFISAIREELDRVSPRPLLTAAVSRSPEIIAAVQHCFDQINVMAYDLTSPDLGVTWHNSALYDGGLRDPAWNALVPTVSVAG
jgi:chitinase